MSDLELFNSLEKQFRAGNIGINGIIQEACQWQREQDEAAREVSDKLVAALDHSVKIAEARIPGSWDDLLQYRQLLSEVAAIRAKQGGEG